MKNKEKNKKRKRKSEKERNLDLVVPGLWQTHRELLAMACA